MIYNFGIERLKHFSSKIVRKWQLNRGMLHCFVPERRNARPTPCRARPPRPPLDRTPRQPTTRRSVRRGAAHVEPPSQPSLCAPRAHARRAGHPTTSPPYARSAAPGWQLAVAPRRPSSPILRPCKEWTLANRLHRRARP
jgi:hypothetical protein